MPALLTQIVEPPELGDGQVGGRGQRRRVGDVEPARGATRPPVASDSAATCGRGGLVEVAGDDVGAGLGQPADDLGAETAAGPGHDGPPPAQRHQLGECPVTDVRHDHRPGHYSSRSLPVTWTIADADAIRRLLHAYADAVLARDEAAWGALWTEDRRGSSALAVSIEGRSRSSITGARRWPLPPRRPALPEQHRHDRRRRPPPGGRTSSSSTCRWRVTVACWPASYDDAYRRAAGRWWFSGRSLNRLYAGAPDLSGQFFGPDFD